MVALGIVVNFPQAGRPAAACVVTRRDPAGKPELVDRFQITSEDINRAAQLHALGQAIRSRVESLDITAVWIRTAEATARIGSKPGPRIRLHAEGGIALAAREVIPNVHLGDGRTIGKQIGGSKAAADGMGAALLGSRRRKVDEEAAAASLAALAAPPITP